MYTCRCCILLPLFHFQELPTGRGKPRPFIRAVTFREKWKEGGVRSPCTYIKEINQIFHCRGNKSRGSSVYLEGEVERKSLRYKYLLSGSLINHTSRKFKVSLILFTVNFISSLLHSFLNQKTRKMT